MRRLARNLGLLLAVLLLGSAANRTVTGFWSEDGLGAWGPVADALTIFVYTLPLVLIYLFLLRTLHRRFDYGDARLRVAAVVLSPLPFFLLIDATHYESGLASLEALVLVWLPMLAYALLVQIGGPKPGEAAARGPQPSRQG